MNNKENTEQVLFREPNEYGERRSGRTTAIIDKAINDFFENGYVWVVDHFDSEAAQTNAAKRFIDRLRREHRVPYNIISYDIIESNGYLGRDLGTVFFKAEKSDSLAIPYSPLPGLRASFDNYLLDIGKEGRVRLVNYRVIC